MLAAFDTETWLIQPGLLAPRLVCGSWATGDPQRPSIALAARRDALDGYAGALERGYRLVLQNAAYDLAVVCAERPELLAPTWAALEAGHVSDTLIRERLIRNACGELKYYRGRPTKFSLDALVERYCGADISGSKNDPGAWRLRYWELDGVPVADYPEAASAYAVDDAVWTLRVHAAQTEAARPLGIVDEARPWLLVDEGRLVHVAFALHLASVWGVRTSAVRLDKLEAELRERVGEIGAKLQQAGIQRPDGSMSIAALEERITAAFGSNPPRGEATEKMREKAEADGVEAIGNVKRDAETLVSCSDPLLREYGVALRPAWHLANTIPELRAGTERPINPQYSLPMATGRTSSNRPNCQNWPRKGGFRECLEPRLGYAFVWADYGQLELCTLAQIWIWLFGSSTLADAIRAGKDLHLMLAGAFLGQPYDALSKATHKDIRDFCKEGNYGFPVGMGPAKFYTRLIKRVAKGDVSAALGERTVHDCTELREAWRRTWPESALYFQWIQQQLDAGGQFRSWITGRLRGGCEFTDLGNSGFQGLAADGATDACIAVQRECYLVPSSPLYGSRLVAFIHDELLLETPRDRIHEAAERLSRIMVERMERYTPDVPIEAEACASLSWSKSAKPVRDESGRLVLWEA